MRLIGLSGLDTARLTEVDRSLTAEAEQSKSEPNTEPGENMAAPRRKVLRCIKIMLAISALGTVFVLVRVHFLEADNVLNFSLFAPHMYKIDDTVKLKLSDNSLSFSDSVSGRFLKIHFTGDDVNAAPDLDSCVKILGNADAIHDRKLDLELDPFVKSMCLKWKDTELLVNDTLSRGSRCFSVRWRSWAASSPLNCVLLSGAHWYGGSLLREQQWPLEDASIPMQPFTSTPLSVFQRHGKLGDYGPVLERMWINSGGFAIIADSDEPLHVSVNAHQKACMCLKTQLPGNENLSPSRKSPLTLRYTVCMDRTAKHVHGHVVKEFLTLPREAPSERLMQDPVWSTRGINMNNLTEKQALELKNDITKNNFLHSQIHIAGNVTGAVGEVFFDHHRFPHAHQMAMEMKFEGFSVATTVLPLLDSTLLHFQEAAQRGALLDGAKEWRGKVGVVDFSKPQACGWMSQRLKSFRQESSISAFHFDLGEAAMMLGSQVMSTPLPLPLPCDYNTHYARFAHTMGNDSVVSMGYRSQEFPLLLDLGARNSSWGYDLGLKSIIPSVLTLGILGYPFVMVGPVGGVPVEDFRPETNSFALPDEELYVRWLQLSLFLPSLEMSVGPWQYSGQVVDMARALLTQRAQQVVPVLLTAVQEFLRTGAPLVRPLWWLAPDDPTAQTIDCQFLLSNTLLVAPVLEAGARGRDIYLPKVKAMKWKDTLRGQVYAGGQWLRGYRVELTEVATFTPLYTAQADNHLTH